MTTFVKYFGYVIAVLEAVYIAFKQMTGIA